MSALTNKKNTTIDENNKTLSIVKEQWKALTQLYKKNMNIDLPHFDLLIHEKNIHHNTSILKAFSKVCDTATALLNEHINHQDIKHGIPLAHVYQQPKITSDKELELALLRYQLQINRAKSAFNIMATFEYLIEMELEPDKKNVIIKATDKRGREHDIATLQLNQTALAEHLVIAPNGIDKRNLLTCNLEKTSRVDLQSFVIKQPEQLDELYQIIKDVVFISPSDDMAHYPVKQRIEWAKKIKNHLSNKNDKLVVFDDPDNLFMQNSQDTLTLTTQVKKTQSLDNDLAKKLSFVPNLSYTASTLSVFFNQKYTQLNTLAWVQNLNHFLKSNQLPALAYDVAAQVYEDQKLNNDEKLDLLTMCLIDSTDFNLRKSLDVQPLINPIEFSSGAQNKEKIDTIQPTENVRPRTSMRI